MKKQLFIFFAALCSLSALAQTVPAHVPSNGLVGWYSFTGNANDESGFGNNGIINGATLTAGKLAIPNSAYLFNGTSNVINLLNPFLGGTQVNAFSFHALIKLNSFLLKNLSILFIFIWIGYIIFSPPTLICIVNFKY